MSQRVTTELRMVSFASSELRDTRSLSIVSSVPGSETKARRRPGRPRRPTTDHAITHAALDLLAERGFQAATIEAIALRAEVGRNTIYRRWRSKEELIADALRELTTDFDALAAEDLYSLLLNWLRDFARTFSDPVHGRLLAGVLGELQQNPVFADVYVDRVVRPRREALLARLGRPVNEASCARTRTSSSSPTSSAARCCSGSCRSDCPPQARPTPKSSSRRSGAGSRQSASS